MQERGSRHLNDLGDGGLGDFLGQLFTFDRRLFRRAGPDGQGAGKGGGEGHSEILNLELRF